jgi:two-component system OmpR family sensor kinase
MRLPLKLRLTVVFGAVMAIALIALGTVGYIMIKADLLDSVDTGLRPRAQALVNAIARSREPQKLLSEGGLIDADEAFAQVLDGSGRLIESTSAVSAAPLLSADEVRSISKPYFATRGVGDISPYEDVDDPFRLLAVRVESDPDRIAVVGATLSDVNEALNQFLSVMLAIGPLAIVMTAGAGRLLAGATLLPVEQMRKEAAAVSAAEPARRLLVPRTGDELARLATTLNSMLDRLQAGMERERRFVDNASHELRTPLATLRGEIELALARRRKSSELVASLQRAQEDVYRLQRLVEDVLILARSRGGRIPVRRVETPLAGLVARAVESVADQARGAGVTVETETFDDSVNVDPDRMHQALRNLLENAIRHTPPGGNISVSAGRSDETVQVVVADSGPGFSPERLGSVFDPFMQSQGEGSDSGGTGLGLAIVKAVAESHGGSVVAENMPHGARVTLKIGP